MSAKRKATDNSDDRKGLYVKHCRALNNQFSNWVKEQLQTRPVEQWTAGVEDYLEHAKKIQAEFSDVIDAESNGAGPPGGFGSSPPAAKAVSFGGAVSFGAPPSAVAAAAPPFAFGGGSPAASATAPAPFAFGGGASTPPPMFAGLANAGSTPAAIKPGGGDTGGGDDDEQPDSPTVVKAQEDDGTEDVKMDLKAKLHVKVAGEASWADRGVGQLSVRIAKEAGADGKKPARLLFRSVLMGKLLVNTRIYKGIKVLMANSKKTGGATMTLYLPEEKKADLTGGDDGTPKLVPTMVLFKVSRLEDSKQLKDEIDAIAENL